MRRFVAPATVVARHVNRSHGAVKGLRMMCTAPASVTTRREQAVKMSFDTKSDAPITPRKVPASAQEFEAARRAYNEEVSGLRKAYKAQWDARREVEEAEAKESRRRIMLRKAENERLKSVRRRKVALKHKATRERVNASAQADRNYRLAARRAYVDKVTQRRRAWLEKLEADSKSWIPEDKIDEMITEDTFALTYPWHLEEWYARRNRRRQLQAARERGEAVDFGTSQQTAQPDMVEALLVERNAQIREARAAGDSVDFARMLEGDESVFVSTVGHGQSKGGGAGYESDEDMLDGFGSDWEEDVPSTNWFARAERASHTGVQLEELYFEESLMDIKSRVDAFETAHDAKFPLPEMEPEAWAAMAREHQQGHWSDPLHLRKLEEELQAPHAREHDARRAALRDVESGSDNDA